MALGLYRILWSLVRTIQPFLPTAFNQVSSAVVPEKWSSWISTRAPLCRNATATCRCPRERSINKIGRSGCCLELATDRFFDFIPFGAVVDNQIINALTRFISLGYNRRSDTATANDRATQ